MMHQGDDTNTKKGNFSNQLKLIYKAKQLHHNFDTAGAALTFGLFQATVSHQTIGGAQQ